MAAPNAILLVSSADQKGLVARLSDFIYRNNGNIVHVDQHIDTEAGLFLMRIEWSLADFRIEPHRIGQALEPLVSEFHLNCDLRFSDHIPKAAIFVSKHDHCLLDLLLRYRAGELQTNFSLVVSNHPDLRPVAEDLGIDYLTLPIRPENKSDQEIRMLAELRKRKIELVILARYMQILSDEFVDHFRNRMINIHHSFLPAFVGSKPYHQAFHRGVKIIGATSHYVTGDLDNGPIIAQDVINITHRDSIEDLIRKGRDLEKVVLARAVSLHLESRILVYGNKTVVFD
jgi:formyltetrahydrofolate deformylase